VLRSRDTETERERESGHCSHALQEGWQIVRQTLTRSGHAGQRDAVDEATRTSGHLAQMSIGARRRHHKDQIAPGRPTEGVEFVAFVRWKIRHDHAVDADLDTRMNKPLQTILEQWIEVSHEDERNVNTLLTQPRCRLQAEAHRHPIGQRDMARPLDRHTVRQRIGKGNPQFHCARSATHQSRNQFQRTLPLRIADREIGDDPQLPSCTQRREGVSDPARPSHHSVTPSALATVCISLSPRPERLTTMTWSRGRSLANCTARAIA